MLISFVVFGFVFVFIVVVEVASLSTCSLTDFIFFFSFFETFPALATAANVSNARKAEKELEVVWLRLMRLLLVSRRSFFAPLHGDPSAAFGWLAFDVKFDVKFKESGFGGGCECVLGD